MTLVDLVGVHLGMHQRQEPAERVADQHHAPTMALRVDHGADSLDQVCEHQRTGRRSALSVAREVGDDDVMG